MFVSIGVKWTIIVMKKDKINEKLLTHSENSVRFVCFVFGK